VPERDRQLARVLNLFLSVAAAVTFAVAAPMASAAQPDSRLREQQPSTSGSNAPSGSNKSSTAGKPSGTSSRSSGAQTTSSKPAGPSVCPSAVTPPPVPNDGEGDPVPPLDVPEEPVGGDRMGECGLVLPANATLPPDKLTAASWVISDQDTGDVLAAYAPHARQRPAGTIKILLAMVALRDLAPDSVIVATKTDTRQKLSRVGLVADGKYTAHDLIRALIVTSGSDVANAIARALGGPDEAVTKMNALAAELKATDTRVMNPNGTDQPGMSTSAFDSALIYREAMRIPEFADATGSSTVVIRPQGNRNTKITRPNDNKMLDSYKDATGGKSGLTDAAKSTFVGSATKDGKNLIVSIMRSDKVPFDQAGALMTYGFTLIAAKVQPVGRIGTTVEPAKTTRDSSAQSGSEQDNVQANATTLQRSAFGNFGLPVTILAGVVVLLAMVLTLRRRMARSRRLRAQQAR
jgi:D-alanyl-D-alanine carboxypeptidase (penicillin-binding protein 5/6)